jgi:hypothetical protein
MIDKSLKRAYFDMQCNLQEGQMNMTVARVEKILGEVREAHRQEARTLVEQFFETDRIGVAEILADADAAQKFDQAKLRVEDFVETDIGPNDLSDLYSELGLQPSGVERS